MIKVFDDPEVAHAEIDEKGDEHVIYHPGKMIEGRYYRVSYQGKVRILKKNKKSVSFGEFIPDD